MNYGTADWLSKRVLYTRLRKFDSYPYYFGLVAQWLEQGTHNPLAGGSNPSESMFKLLYSN